MKPQKSKITKLFATLGIVFATGVAATSLSACGDEVDPNSPEALFYNAMVKSAETQFKTIQNITDDKTYVQGVVSFDYNEDSLLFCAYTEDYAIIEELSYNFGDKNNVATIFIKKVENNDSMGIRVEVFERTKGEVDEKAKKAFYDCFIDNSSSNKDRYYGKDPVKLISCYISKEKKPNQVYYNSSCLNGVGNYITLTHRGYDIEEKSTVNTGSGDEFTPEDIGYKIIKNIILK